MQSNVHEHTPLESKEFIAVQGLDLGCPDPDTETLVDTASADFDLHDLRTTLQELLVVRSAVSAWYFSARWCR